MGEWPIIKALKIEKMKKYIEEIATGADIASLQPKLIAFSGINGLLELKFKNAEMWENTQNKEAIIKILSDAILKKFKHVKNVVEFSID